MICVTTFQMQKFMAQNGSIFTYFLKFRHQYESKCILFKISPYISPNLWSTPYENETDVTENKYFIQNFYGQLFPDTQYFIW